MKKTQKQMILEYLKEHKSITSWEAIEKFGATRLSGIIFTPRKEGYEIYTQDIRLKDRYGVSKNVAKYVLVS